MGRLWHEAFEGILGKRISGLVVAKCDDSPQNQVFLIFDDGTYYELYGADVQGCKHIKPGGLHEVSLYLQGRPGVNVVVEIEDAG
jgi:hypothetical protein